MDCPFGSGESLMKGLLLFCHCHKKVTKKDGEGFVGFEEANPS